LVLLVLVVNCGSTKETVDINNITDAEKVAFSQTEGDTITISSEETEYEILIIEPGFNIWLQSIARPEGYYLLFTRLFRESKPDHGRQLEQPCTSTEPLQSESL